MKNSLRAHFILFAFLFSIAALLAPGCGGGSSKAPSAVTTPGMGKVNAVARFSGVETLRRSGAAATDKITVEISISGYYAEDNLPFEPVSSRIELDLSVVHAKVAALAVPIGRNHVMTAKATYPDGSSETIKAIIPEVVEGSSQTVEADQGSSVVAEAAIIYASENNKILPAVSPADILKFGSAVYSLSLKGVPYSEMQPGIIADISGNTSIVFNMSVNPSSVTLHSGDAQEFSVSASNIYRETLAPTVSWQVSGNSGTITQAGIFTAGAIGSAIVTATAGTVSATSAVTVVEGSITTLTVSAAQSSITAGGSTQLTATAEDAGGNIISVTPAWTATGGSVDSSGLFSSETSGTVTVTATVDGVTGSTTITVNPGTTSSLTISPDPASVVSGATVQFSAAGYDQFGNATAISPTWTASGGNGSINSSGLFTATTAGAGTVSASYGNIVASTGVTVIAGSLSSITVTGASSSALAGETVQFTATATDGNGNSISITPTWTVSGSVGTINSSGAFTATTAGTGTITAEQGGVSGSATISVSAGALAVITISPSASSLTAGETVQLTASGQDAYGNPVSVSPTWSISGGGSISTTGLYSATTAGSANVSAVSGNVSGNAVISVSAGALSTISISPSTASILSGETITFAATGADAYGNNVSVTPSWTVSGGTGSIDTYGVFTGTTSGTGTVTATAGAVTASVNVSVSPGALASIVVSPSSATVTVGGTQAFSASGFDANGNAVTMSETWSVTGGIGTVDSGGNFTATAKGTGGVSAASGGVTGSATITVPNTAPTASAGPDMTTLAGVGVTIGGSGSDADGDSLTYSWTQSGPSTLTLSGDATPTPAITTVNAGTYTLTLTVSDGTDSTSDSMTLLVTTTPAPVITSITPDSGSNGGATVITITGTDFVSGATVNIGATAATGVSVVSATSITATVPAGITPGIYEISVTNPDSQAATFTGFSVLGAGVTHSGTVSASQTWLAADSPHIVTADVTVAGTCNGPTLTIEAGAVVKFDPGTTLNVGTSNCGILIADGTAAPILFTSNATTPAPGDWNGIVMGINTRTGTTLNGVIIEYAGGTGSNLNIGATTPTIYNSTIRYSSDRGVLFNSSGGASGFTGNIIYGNAYPIDVYANYASTIGSGNTLTGNTNDVILVQAGTVSTSGTWANNGAPMEVQGAITMSGSISIDPLMTVTFLGSVTVAGTCNGPILTIGAGSTIMFGLNVALNIGTTNCGSLIADGSTGAITLTSAIATPAPGDWEGINFGVNTRTGSLLDNVTVEYAGYGGTSAIDFSASVVAVQNSTISNSGGYGVNFADNIFPLIFTNNSITMNSSYPMNIYGEFLRYIPSGNSFTGNNIDEIQIWGDTISTTGTWYNHGVPLYINGSLSVMNTCNGPVLTIEAGNTLKFEAGALLDVGTANCGSIVADGTGATITFTSAQSTPAAGDWQGLTIGVNARTGTLLNNVVIEYGGATKNASVTVSANIATISNSVISNGLGTGVEFKDGGGGMGTFTGNTVTGHSAYPINIFANYMQSLPGGNALTGNGTDVILVQPDSIGTAGTWANNGIPIEVVGSISVAANTTFDPSLDVTLGDVTIANTCNGPILTIGAFDILRFQSGTGLDVATTNCGTLIADGTAGQIVMTSAAATPAAGDWRGVRFGVNTRTGTLLNNVEISYAGNTNGAGVWFNNTTLPAVNSTNVLYTGGTGVKFDDGTYPSSFSLNTISGSTDHPMEIYGNYLDKIPAGSSLTGNATDTVKVYGDNITTTGKWQMLDVPYEVMGDLIVANTCNGPAITIDPGVTMKFHNNAGIYVGTTNCGSLYVDGTLSQVVFTSIQPTPAPGDWDGIQFGINTRAGTFMTYATVEYGGSNGFGNIYLNNVSSNVSLTNLNVSYSSAFGVYTAGSSIFSAPDIASIIFTGNVSGTVGP